MRYYRFECRVGKVEFLIQVNNVWSREQAELEVRKIFDAAKKGILQRVEDKDGSFDVVFRRRGSRRRASDVLAKGGPLED